MRKPKTTTAASAKDGAGKGVENFEGKPLSSADEPEAQLQDRAGLPADDRAGDRKTMQDEAEARKLYPFSCAALDRVSEALPAEFKGEIVVRITTRQDGFRRAGMAHVGTADHKVADLTLAQLEMLMSEPVLTVEIVGVE